MTGDEQRDLRLSELHGLLQQRISQFETMNAAVGQAFAAADHSCRIPSDHIPIRSWPLFLARELMRDLIETLKAEQST